MFHTSEKVWIMFLCIVNPCLQLGAFFCHAAGGPSNRRVLLSRAPQRRETFVDQVLMSFTSHTAITKGPA